MNNKYYKPVMIASALTLLFASAGPAFAMDLNGDVINNTAIVAQANNDPIRVNATISVAVRTDANTKIDARIKSLSDLRARIDSMQKVSTQEKASLEATIDNSISAMTTLKAKIDADTDVATFRIDVQSITKSYRIYVLVLPQGRITAASDRILTIGGLMTALSAKLQTRITAAQTSGKDVTSLNASLTDFNSKISDSNIQAQAALTEIANLSPDNGDKTIFSTNQQALQDAKAKIKVSISDLKTARQDAATIASTLKSWNVSVSASASTTTK